MKVADFTLRVGVLIVLGLLAYEYLGSRTDHISIFVAVRKEASVRFVDRFAAHLRSKGLSPAIGHATDDQGKVATVVEARGTNSRVWMSHVTLSGQEVEPECEKHFEPYPDPSQFEIRVRSRFRLLPGSRAKARYLAEMVEQYLKREGQIFRSTPWACGATALKYRAVAAIEEDPISRTRE